MLLSIILISLLCSIIMTQLGNLLAGQKSVSFKIIQDNTHGIFDIVIDVSRFRICHFNILYCKYCKRCIVSIATEKVGVTDSQY